MARDHGWMLIAAVVLGGGVVYTMSTRAPRALPSAPRPELQVTIVDGGPGSAASAAPVPVVLRGPRMWFSVGLYFLKPPREPLAGLDAAKGFRVVAKMPASSPVDAVVEVAPRSIDKYPPPSLQTLSYFGHHLTEDEKGELQKSSAAVGVAFEAPVSPTALPDAMWFVAELAARNGAFVVDLDTRQVYSAREWKLRAGKFSKGVPDVEWHITIHAYRDGELFRLVTLGMNKFALPELVAEQVAGNSAKSMGSLLNLVAQTLVERGKLDAEGRLVLSVDKKTATVQLAVAKPKEGDAPNTVIELAFPGVASSLQQRHTALLAQLFGATEDAVRVDDDDPELLAARKRAKATLVAKVKPRWKGGEPPDHETLTVKAPFATSSGKSEWMWVEIFGWTGPKMAGVLQNTPFEVPELAAGARVEVEESSIYDYVVTKYDGTTEGGETTAIILRRQK